MSLAGFLFGNVDEDGNLSDSELDSELRNTLGDGERGSYLSSVLGSSLFSDAADKGRPSSAAQRGEEDDDEDEEEDGDEARGRTPAAAASLSAASTNAYGSPAIRPAQDAVDYSDFNELADDAAVPRTWAKSMSLATPLASGLRHSYSAARAQLDDDYDSEEDGDSGAAAAGVAAAKSLPLPTGHGDEAGDFAGSDEENLEDLFESPEQTAAEPTALGAGGADDEIPQIGALPPSGFGEAADASVPGQPARDAVPVVPRGVKRIPAGTIKFTDFFGSQIVRRIKRHRRERPEAAAADGSAEAQFPAPAQPPLDTRKLLLGAHDVERPESYLRSVIASSMAADENSDVYVVIDADTGAVTAQMTRPKRAPATSAELFRSMPFPLDIDDWESSVIWSDDRGSGSGSGEAEQPALEPRQTNALVDDYEKHIIWDAETPFQPCTQLQINLNDTHMLFEDANSIKESNAREAERLRLLEGVDRFNLSNDHFYEALQEGKVHRVRQTFGQLIVAHSLPALRLLPPYFKMRHTRADLRSWHRPCLQPPVDAPIRFERVRTAKKRKQKHSMENPWAAKDITLRDSADCVLVEYAEEYPLVVSNVGMGSVLVNYYRKRDIQDRAFPEVDIGELFVLDVADISPFLNFGNIEPGHVVPALYNNMFRAPLFAHKTRPTDFLAVKHVAKGETRWYVRAIRYQYVAGQTYPLQEVPAPHSRKVTTTIKHRLQVAAYRLMSRNHASLLQMGKLARMFPEYSELQIRQRLKEFCEYQRKGLGAGYWRPKASMPLPDEDNLRKMLTPEMLCVFESMRVCQQQLHDAGKMGDGDGDDTEAAAESTQSVELVLATWNLTRNFINATQSKAMLQLHGEGDPTGRSEGFSFVRVSMKDIFLRAGESVEEKLAEIEARPKSAHRYNVAEQQQIYKEEIACIWDKQFRALSRTRPHADRDAASAAEEAVIVPKINDLFGDAALTRSTAAIDPARAAPGNAMDVSRRLADELNPTQSATAHANFVRPNRKGLVVRRAVRSPYTGELTWRTEVVRDLAVIQAYLRQRRIIENRAHRHSDLFDDDDSDDGFGSPGHDPQAAVAAETQAHLARLERARSQREAGARAHEKTHMTTFSLPQPNKPKKGVIRQCGNCGMLGHMKTNKKCPRYYEFNPV